MSAIKINNVLSVDVRESTIGPRNDPYGQTVVVLQQLGGECSRAVYVHNGLGMNKVSLFSDYQSAPVRELSWRTGTGSIFTAPLRLKANLLVKQLFGTRLDEAIDAYWEAMSKVEPDLYGPESRYI